MIALAISALWVLFGILCLAGVVWLILYGINEFIYSLPARLVQGVWFLFLLLCIIAILTLFAGGGSFGGFHPFRG